MPRSRAAKSLAQAGLLEDAAQLYVRLLRATDDSGWRTVLENEIQHFHLMRAAAEREDSEQ